MQRQFSTAYACPLTRAVCDWRFVCVCVCVCACVRTCACVYVCQLERDAGQNPEVSRGLPRVQAHGLSEVTPPALSPPHTHSRTAKVPFQGPSTHFHMHTPQPSPPPTHASAWPSQGLYAPNAGPGACGAPPPTFQHTLTYSSASLPKPISPSPLPSRPEPLLPRPFHPESPHSI